MKAPATAIVVGAGFAGLAAAIDLARAGVRVTLIERANTPGGKAAEWRADGFRFDMGPSVFTLPDVVDAIFHDAGAERPFDLQPLDPICRYIYPSGRVWDVHHDLEATLAGLNAREQRAYQRALQVARRMYEDAAPTFVRSEAPGPMRMLAYAVRGGWRARPGMSLPALLASLGVDGDLLPFFLRFATYFGGDPYRAPAVLHNIAWVELGLGVWQPVGGVHAVVQALSNLAQRLGVQLRTSVAVEAISVRAQRVHEVITDAGRFTPDMVVSAIDRRWTRQLLGAKPAPTLHPSLSGTVLLLGVRGTHPRLTAHNILFPIDYAREFTEMARGEYPSDPTVYLHASAKADAADAPSDHENWFVMANAPALTAGDTRGAPRAGLTKPDASSASARAVERLHRTLSQRGLDVANSTVVARAVRPEDLANFGDRGAIYGPAPRGLLGTLRPGPRVLGVHNLMLAGGTVHPGGGIPLALLSGRYAAAALLRQHRP